MNERLLRGCASPTENGGCENKMTYVKIGGVVYPAGIVGVTRDREGNNRESKAITVEMTYAAAATLFADETPWSILQDTVTGTGEAVQAEYDNSDYSVAGAITDHRNGRVTVKMGKPTAEELLAVLAGEEA